MSGTSAVVVFGSINMDLSVACDRMPQAGETIAGAGFFAAPGGKGANQAVAAARLGASTQLIGAVGTDAFGEELVGGLESAGVGCRHVAARSDAPTGTATILRCAGDNRIVLSPGANTALSAAEAVSALDAIVPDIDPATSVLVAQGECDLAATEVVLIAAHERGMRTLFNPAPACRLSARGWAAVDLLCLNETECAEIAGVLPTDDATIAQACTALSELGVGEVVVTLGGAGSAAFSQGRVFRVAARPAQVVDTTAAGDTFIGALAAGMTEGRTLAESMELGSQAAALCVGRLGAQPAIPLRAEVDAAMVAGMGC